MASFVRSAATVVRTLACAALGAFALWVSDGREAAASCGDWLEGHQAGMAAAHGATVRGGKAGVADGHPIATGHETTGEKVTAGVPRGGAPCRGPACRRAPVKPLLPLDGGVIRIDIDRFAWLVGLEFPAAVGRGRSIATVDVAPFSTDSGRLDRPPRAA